MPETSRPDLWREAAVAVLVFAALSFLFCYPAWDTKYVKSVRVTD